ncbi:MAG: TonB-dependent receptor [Gammaproteobacteria bacterium]|nr:TonB-dependent receptor [Gammaproteobacteria bacterium]
MDIGFIDTEILQLEARHQLGEVEFRLTAGTSHVEHGMSNNLLRPTPDLGDAPAPWMAGDDARRTLADADGRELDVRAILPALGGTLELGLGWREEHHDARVGDPDSPPFVDSFVDARLDVTTAFADWQRSLGNRTGLRAGLRLVRTGADADPVNAFPATLVDAAPGAWPMGTPPRAIHTLRERFNAADRDRTDTELDWSLALEHRLDTHLTLTGTLARRSRAASFQERFLWLPMEATSGLADGNTYVGDPALDPEVSRIAGVALHWQTSRLEATLEGYWREIDGAILGVPATDPLVIGVSGGMGDPSAAAFAATDASIRGIEASVGWQLADHWRLDAGLAWQRGERTAGEDDPLWRIAPPNASLTLGWNAGFGHWRLTQELVARGDRLSRIQLDDPANPVNEFTETAGYGLTHLRSDWALMRGLRLTLGVDNLFDREHVAPLAGFNRAEGNVVPSGARPRAGAQPVSCACSIVPGPGTAPAGRRRARQDPSSVLPQSAVPGPLFGKRHGSVRASRPRLGPAPALGTRHGGVRVLHRPRLLPLLSRAAAPRLLALEQGHVHPAGGADHDQCGAQRLPQGPVRRPAAGRPVRPRRPGRRLVRAAQRPCPDRGRDLVLAGVGAEAALGLDAGRGDGGRHQLQPPLPGRPRPGGRAGGARSRHRQPVPVPVAASPLPRLARPGRAHPAGHDRLRGAGAAAAAGRHLTGRAASSRWARAPRRVRGPVRRLDRHAHVPAACRLAARRRRRSDDRPRRAARRPDPAGDAAAGPGTGRDRRRLAADRDHGPVRDPDRASYFRHRAARRDDLVGRIRQGAIEAHQPLSACRTSTSQHQIELDPGHRMAQAGTDQVGHGQAPLGIQFGRRPSASAGLRPPPGHPGRRFPAPPR